MPVNSQKIGEIQKAILQEGLDGWLFCNFRHRDRLADKILGVRPANVNSRFWFYALPASGEPLAILHAIEPDSVGPELPGARVFYCSREELVSRLSALAGKRWGVHVSDAIPAISYLDAGTAALLGQAGLVLVSAGGLLQRFLGLLDSRGIAAHERAAGQLYEIAGAAWGLVQKSYALQTPLYEGDVQRFITEEFERRGLSCDHPPIVAAGINTANPHYEIGANSAGTRFCENDLVQFDIFAKDASPGGIYADISWVGVYAKEPQPRFADAFEKIAQAREGALQFIARELEAGRRPQGADVDKKAREILRGFGLLEAARHRTGHGIDSEVHGSGATLDSWEFPDTRLLLDGSCFSIEPGIYLPDFGMRTEIDVYIANGRPIVSGGERQFKILAC
jgi:Xaa-Pro aminopeptidase